MNIEYYPDWQHKLVKDKLKDFAQIKFAVFKKLNKETRDFVMLLFAENHTHCDVVRNRMKGDDAKEQFIGAGYLDTIGRKCRADWNSESCQKEIGHDRPEELAEQEAVIEEVKKTVLALFKR